MKRRGPGLPPAIQSLLNDCPCNAIARNTIPGSFPPSQERLQSHLTVRHQLQQRLLQLDFQAFQMLVQRLLTQMGYTPVSVERRHWKGRTRRGGCDFAVSAQTGITRGLVIVQIKHYTRPVQRRFVDELRGTMLRLGARHGLLITTSTFPAGALEAATGDTVAPVRLIDGEALLNLCFVHQLGVRRTRRDGRPNRNGSEDQWALDTALFERLEQAVNNRVRQRVDGTLAPIPPSKRRKVCNNGGLRAGGLLRANTATTTVPVWEQTTFTSPTDGIATPVSPPVAGEAHNINTQGINQIIQRTSGGDMTWRTHTIAGLSSLWLLSMLPNGLTPDNLPFVVAGAAFGALLPDLDAAESKIKHLRIIGIEPLAPVAVSLFRGLGHRGILHSLLGLTIIAAATLLLIHGLGLIPGLGWPVALALVLGYGSHLATDAMTRSGIPWLYPDKRRYHLLPKSWRFVTGSHAETLLFPFLALLFSLLLLRLVVTIVVGGTL